MFPTLPIKNPRLGLIKQGLKPTSVQKTSLTVSVEYNLALFDVTKVIFNNILYKYLVHFIFIIFVLNNKFFL